MKNCKCDNCACKKSINKKESLFRLILNKIKYKIKGR